VTCLWFSPGTLVSSTKKTERHDIIGLFVEGVKHHNPNFIFQF
jgi:hypothetical protein